MTRKISPKGRLIVALDFDSKKKAIDIVKGLKKDVKFFKVGLELFSSCGPTIVDSIRKEGCEVFLDLKFNDIPNTVAKATRSITKLKPFMFNVHALGGEDMMRMTIKAVNQETRRLKIKKPKVLAVTILTSLNENGLKKIGINDNMGAQVLKLARLAKAAGLDGVITSPRETKLIRDQLGKDFLIVTPGVRPSWADSGDQKRVATPREAIESGTSFIVVGRPVTEAPCPQLAAQKILQEIGR